MKLKILSVDCAVSGKGIETTSFYQSASFSDYDALIIDPETISTIWTDKVSPRQDGSFWADKDRDGGFCNRIIGMMSMRSDETILLLNNTGGIVVCFLRNRGAVLNYYLTNTTREVSKYSWIPTFWKKPKLSPYFRHNIRIGKEIGEINKSHPFSRYILGLRDNLYFEAVLTDGDMLNSSHIIAENKVGEVIALEIPVGKGKFIFLPPFEKEIDRDKLSGILIDCIRKSLQWTSPLSKPDWLKSYVLPGEEALLNELEGLDNKLKELNKEKDNILEKFEESECLKGLLYETGKYRLEPSVREAFRILGFAVKDPDEYEEDYDLYAIESEKSIIGEIEGATKFIDVDKYRQLLDYVEASEQKRRRCKGILIGNGFLNVDPSLRGEQFSEHAIKGCERQKYCRLTTYELYKAVSAVLSNPEDEGLKNSIKEKILNCEGEFKFDLQVKGS